MNTWKKIIDDLQRTGDENPSFRTKARAINQWIKSRGFDVQITHDAIRRLEQGIEPKDPMKRKALGLPILSLAPICPDCGQVHVKTHCPHKAKIQPAKPKRNWRKAALDGWALLWGQKA
jgi:hypothetical protein